jgi:hypothetical protein
MKKRTRATLIAVALLVLPILAVMPLSRAQMPTISRSVLLIPKQVFSLPPRASVRALLRSQAKASASQAANPDGTTARTLSSGAVPDSPGAPALSSDAAGSRPGGVPPPPASPDVVLYDQYDNASCTPTWQNEPPMANARRNPAAAVVGSNMYAITGFNSAPNYTHVNERFDGTSWTTLAPIPVQHAQGRAAAVGTNIYVPGGFNSVEFGGPLDTMQIYNTITDTWNVGMNLPAARSGVAAVAYNNLVYVIAGYNPVGTGHGDVYIYDPGTNSYSTGAPMPAGQGNVPGVLYNGEIYVIGGGTAPGARYAYDPVANTWRTIAALPTSGGVCQGGNGFVLDNELWIVGCLGLPISQQVWIYNSGTDMWRAGPQYNVDHQMPGAALFNGRGFAVGGGAGGGGSTAVESVGPCPSVSLTDLSPAKMWVGLAGSDDVGLRLDLLAEVYVNATKAGEGELDNVATGSSGFNNAILQTIALGLTGGPVPAPPGSQLSIKVSARRTCFGGGHASGRGRLWYNGQPIDSGTTRDAGSRFDATIGGSTNDYFLRTGFALNTTPGSARTFVDVFVNSSVACPARPFNAWGTWSRTLP